ncbi:carboxymuconolactone decarboxylase family protein [Pseudotabrizicola sediminis]|uniref:Carboxymuconolactone decarboxylase family protein n=1 Tax=Pseudotabrizicola sediminis TaxID=2486418 RepID=A0ABY2KIM6_9RHOB|nr:carboxymuconolactone decarboxylase family protein [Pseudotabrizicola sediminis]TGD42200.1 carboxymuconolactone decarboxylase family protein [Pseudotabrizicola sediminis]TGD64118.1 carboxymuconolactone decarboxylase family protein [Tabrizicola sp. WMC-M-20]
MTEAYTKMLQQMMEQGQKMASAFMPGMDTIDPKAFEKLFPAMPKELLEMWFGKTFNPEGLDARTRFLVTIAAQTVLGPIGEPQLRMTIKNGLAAGAKQREIAEVIWQMSMFGGLPATQKALEIAQSVFAETEESDT